MIGDNKSKFRSDTLIEKSALLKCSFVRFTPTDCLHQEEEGQTFAAQRTCVMLTALRLFSFLSRNGASTHPSTKSKEQYRLRNNWIQLFLCLSFSFLSSRAAGCKLLVAQITF